MATQRGGRWSDAIPVSSTAVNDPHASGELVIVSCATAGNCAAGGSISRRHGVHAFVISQRYGA